MEQSLTSLDEQDSDIEGRKLVALNMLKRGADREKIIDRTGFTSRELFVIEQTYYDNRDTLDERAQTIKQLDRLDTLLDMAFDQVAMFGLGNEKGDFGANLNAFTTIIREISELAGLKKKRVETEVRVIEEQQINVIVSYVTQVLDEFVVKITPLLTKSGKKQLEEHKTEWYAESVDKPARVLDGSVEL